MIEDVCCGLRVGDKSPEFRIETFDTAKGLFGEFSLAAQMDRKGWTVLFFYPADFTFV